MSSYNKVILMGNLTRKPEVRFTQSGMAICKIGMAVNRRFKDQTGNWKEEPTFVDVTIFGKRGEAFAKFHDKGKQAFIEGELRLDQWEDKQSGEKRSKLYVVGNEWQFVGSGGGREGAGASSGGGGEGDWQEAEASGGYGGGYGGAGGGAGGGGGASAPIDVDDTPF
ncbi:MAG TPA: single-stranded DNA-binding protein [Planctomycetota bacterium]|nr:single-stranded DNA-binding protein [Planctomycetota bacterium]